MSISERIFCRLEELKISQTNFSRMTGIPTSTINDWKHKKTNPSADKLVCICNALQMSLFELLGNEGEKEPTSIDYTYEDGNIIELLNNSNLSTKRTVLDYLEKILNHKENDFIVNDDKRNIYIIKDTDGNKIVVINDIIFKGKRCIKWKDVRKYLCQYVGDFFTIAETKDIIFIGSDFPSEYSGSVYTDKLKGTLAKAKANASQGIPELIEIATGKSFKENRSDKHRWNAKYGWYKYDSRFALPVYCDNGEVERYNVFHASMIIRHANDGRLYLYDIIDIKKETGNPLES